MSERQQAEILLDNIPEQNLHIVIALMRELTGYEDYVECALDEADYLALKSFGSSLCGVHFFCRFLLLLLLFGGDHNTIATSVSIYSDTFEVVFPRLHIYGRHCFFRDIIRKVHS